MHTQSPLALRSPPLSRALGSVLYGLVFTTPPPSTVPTPAVYSAATLLCTIFVIPRPSSVHLCTAFPIILATLFPSTTTTTTTTTTPTGHRHLPPALHRRNHSLLLRRRLRASGGGARGRRRRARTPGADAGATGGGGVAGGGGGHARGAGGWGGGVGWWVWGWGCGCGVGGVGSGGRGGGGVGGWEEWGGEGLGGVGVGGAGKDGSTGTRAGERSPAATTRAVCGMSFVSPTDTPNPCIALARTLDDKLHPPIPPDIHGNAPAVLLLLTAPPLHTKS